MNAQPEVSRQGDASAEADDMEVLELDTSLGRKRGAGDGDSPAAKRTRTELTS